MKPLVLISLFAVSLAHPAYSLAHDKPDVAEAAYKLYKQSGVISPDLAGETVAQLRAKREDCSKPLDQMAFDILNKTHQSELGGYGFLGSLAPVETVRGVIQLFKKITTGISDREMASFLIHANRGAALMYRLESCPAPPRDRPDAAASADPPVAAASAPAVAPVSAPASAAATSAEAAASSPASAAAASSLGPQAVVGLDGWEGLISGRPASNSKFSSLRIGAPVSQVFVDLGAPDSQFFSITPKALIPVNFGSDKYRLEYLYKGVGRLTFSSAQGQGFTEMHLIQIVHDPLETGKL